MYKVQLILYSTSCKGRMIGDAKYGKTKSITDTGRNRTL